MVLVFRSVLVPLLAAGLALGAGPALAARSIAGPVAAQVIEVVDGDTLRVAAHIWIGQDVETLVRIAGIDAPELRGRCERETRLARTARDLLARRLGGRVLLHEVSHGKYAGRVVARVTLPDGGKAGAILLAAGLARPYGDGARRAWCEAAG